MTAARRAVAVLGLGVVAFVLWRAASTGGVLWTPGAVGRRALLLAPIVLAMAGLLTARTWSRWLGLAAAMTVLPWAAVLLGDGRAPGAGPGASAALAAALITVAALAGRPMIEAGEGRMTGIDWRGPRMRWLRWAIIGNLVSALTLYLFVVAYAFQPAWQIVLLATPMAGLLAGVLLLVRQKTAGLLLVWLCCVLILPAGAIFVVSAASDAPDAILFVLTLLPGLVTGWATAFVFGRPVYSFLKTGP